MNQGFGESKLERPLKPGEVLVFSEQNYGGQEQLIDASVPSLPSEFPVISLWIGPKTGVTVFSEENYEGVSQELTAELPSFSGSKLQDKKPKSLKIWPAAGRPFAGYWAIEAAEGQYLSVAAEGTLTTSPTISAMEEFRISDLGESGPGRRIVALSVHGTSFVKPVTSTPSHPLTVNTLEQLTLVEEPEAGFRKFSLLADGDQWICYNSAAAGFLTSVDIQGRTIFCRSIKIAEDETQIGELLSGEAALYENQAYWGKAWIFHADYAHFERIAGLNDVVSSVQLGPLTGATIYRQAEFLADDPKAGKQDVVVNLPSLQQEQVGEDQISSIDLWRVVPPAGTGITIQCRLSQDFRGTGASFEEYSAYRTTLRLPPTVETVDLWATDETEIEVEGQTYRVDEDRPVTLRPNLLGCLIITTDAFAPSEGGESRGSLRAPGLKIRTNTMLPHERITIFPDQEVHKHLANLKEDELWNATFKDRNGEPQPLIRDRNPQKQTDAANAQQMIQKIMSTVKYSEDEAGAWQQAVSPEELKSQVWALDFRPRTALRLSSAKGPRISGSRAFGSASPAVNFREMGRDELQALLAGAVSPDTDLAQWWFFDQVVQAVQNAVSIVVAEVNKVVTVVVETVVETGRKIIQWVVDTAEKVVAFAEAIFEKIGVVINDVVNWLKYVFDWDDILQTRDYLRNSFVKSLDYMGETLVQGAREPVSKFFKDTKHIVTDSFDRAIEALGGSVDESASASGASGVVSSQISKLFETGEWILSKVMSAGPGGMTFALATVDPMDREWDEKLRRFSEQTLAGGLANIAVIPEGVVEVIGTLVRNPDKPLLAVAALLKVFRSLALGIIEIGEDIVLGLLDLVTYLIKKIKEILTADIRIPFIADILKWMGLPETLGFSLLDVATLIMAIPVTAISKIVLHEVPFKNESMLAQNVTGWTILAGTCDLLGGLINAPLDGAPEESLGTAKNTMEVLSFVFTYSSTFATWGPGLWGADNSEQHDGLYWTLFGMEAFFFAADILSFRVGSLSEGAFKLARFKRAAKWSMVTTSIIGLIHAGLLVAHEADKIDVLAKVPEIFSFVKIWDETPLSAITGPVFIMTDVLVGGASFVNNLTDDSPA